MLIGTFRDLRTDPAALAGDRQLSLTLDSLACHADWLTSSQACRLMLSLFSSLSFSLILSYPLLKTFSVPLSPYLWYACTQQSPPRSSGVTCTLSSSKPAPLAFLPLLDYVAFPGDFLVVGHRVAHRHPPRVRAARLRGRTRADPRLRAHRHHRNRCESHVVVLGWKMVAISEARRVVDFVLVGEVFEPYRASYTVLKSS